MNLTINFQPAFKRIQQLDRHDDIFPLIASITGKTFTEVLQFAETLGVPKTGPYCYWIDEILIVKVFAHFGWVATVWQACEAFDDLPELAIVMVDYNEALQVGRNILAHRLRGSDGKVLQYVIDPYPHSEANLHLRTGLTGLQPSWYIGLHPHAKPAAK